jgi:hypothetical protein
MRLQKLKSDFRLHCSEYLNINVDALCNGLRNSVRPTVLKVWGHGKGRRLRSADHRKGCLWASAAKILLFMRNMLDMFPSQVSKDLRHVRLQIAFLWYSVKEIAFPDDANGGDMGGKALQ